MSLMIPVRGALVRASAAPADSHLTRDNRHVPAPQRTARIEDDIWAQAQARAKADGASLAALMRAAIQRYTAA
jgi:hypothetical protein